MRRSLTLALAPLAACGLLAGCPLGSAQAPRTLSPGASVEDARMQGRVAFPAREVAATPVEVARRATVSVIDANQQTVAATLTDANGAFSLALGFAPAPGAFYVVEAIKPLSSGDSGGRVVRLRTLVQWTGNAWTSCTGAAIALTPTTTAVCVIKATQPTLGFPEAMGIVANEAVVSTHPTLNTHWASVKEMVGQLLARDLDPLGGILYQGAGYALASDRAALFQPNLAQGSNSNTWLLLDGSLQLSGSLPRPRTADQDSFAASGIGTAGVIATDGRHLYMKPWDAAGTWNVIGSGFGGTVKGNNYGTLINSTTRTLNVACYGGYIYQALYGSGNNGTLERIATASGAVTTMPLATPLIFRETAVSDTGSYANLGTDGTYFYNAAFVLPGGGKTGFTVRVFDPANNFAFVRQLTMDGANTSLAGTGYNGQATSFIADGVYLYALEWSEGNSPDPALKLKSGMARLRRYRLADSQFEAETTFASAYNNGDPLTGCYDWVNNKFWFADYMAAKVRMLPGRSFPGTGTWTSTPIDLGGVSPLYGRLNFNAVTTEAGQAVRLRLRSANDPNALASATWYGPTGTGDYYTTSGSAVNPIHQRNRWAQIQATLLASTDSITVANTTPRLYGVSLEAVP